MHGLLTYSFNALLIFEAIYFLFLSIPNIFIIVHSTYIFGSYNNQSLMHSDQVAWGLHH